jgi:hypothetical protein
MHGNVESANAASLGGIRLGAMVAGRIGVVTGTGTTFGEVARNIEGRAIRDVEYLLPLGRVVEV